MPRVSTRSGLTINCFHKVPEKRNFHCLETEFGNIVGGRVIIIVVHTMGTSEVRLLHSEIFRVMIHLFVESLKAFFDFEHQFGELRLFLDLLLGWTLSLSCWSTFSSDARIGRNGSSSCV